MSKQELARLEVVQQVTERQMRQRDAARALSVSERQVKRLVRAFRADGVSGLVSKRRGQPSNHKLDATFKEQALERLRTRYPESPRVSWRLIGLSNDSSIRLG